MTSNEAGTNAVPATARVALLGGIVALIFALISWRAHSVGWLFSCAATSVSAIVAFIFGFVGLTGGKGARGRHLAGIILGVVAAVLIYYSYLRVSLHGGI